MVVRGAAVVCAHGTPVLHFITLYLHRAHTGVRGGQHRARILDRGSEGSQARHQVTAKGGGRSLVICTFTFFVIMCLQSCMTSYEKISTSDSVRGYPASRHTVSYVRLVWF
jgi:hypothetical protein